MDTNITVNHLPNLFYLSTNSISYYLLFITFYILKIHEYYCDTNT